MKASQLVKASQTVTAKGQDEIRTGHRPRLIDADDLVEVLLSIADILDEGEK